MDDKNKVKSTTTFLQDIYYEGENITKDVENTINIANNYCNLINADDNINIQLIDGFDDYFGQPEIQYDKMHGAILEWQEKTLYIFKDHPSESYFYFKGQLHHITGESIFLKDKIKLKKSIEKVDKDILKDIISDIPPYMDFETFKDIILEVIHK